MSHWDFRDLPEHGQPGQSQAVMVGMDNRNTVIHFPRLQENPPVWFSYAFVSRHFGDFFQGRVGTPFRVLLYLCLKPSSGIDDPLVL